MTKFIRTIGKCAVNDISFDVYENKDGSATVRPNNRGTDFPKSKFIKFDSLDVMDVEIDNLVGEDVLGAQRVQALKRVWLNN